MERKEICLQVKALSKSALFHSIIHHTEIKLHALPVMVPEAKVDLVGGHTLWMADEGDGIDNIIGCKAASCHPNATTFDIDGKQTEIEGKFQDLKVKLAAANMLDTNTMLLKTGKYYKQIQLAIFWNFQMIYSDRSMGVHNYKYTRDMLQSGIDYYNSK